MQNVKLIASDMDQTLLTSEGTLPPHFDRYLQRLNQAGIEFVAASGRPPVYLAGNLSAFY